MPYQPAPENSSRPLVRVATADEAALAVAHEAADLIRSRAARGQRTVLGLATGRTPVGIYAEWVRLYEAGELSFESVTSFNLDEYIGLGATHPCSYRSFMQRVLFQRVDIDPAEAHLPHGDLGEAALEEECERYENALELAGGIDFQLLGLGRNGHVAFNEPGSLPTSRTRVIDLHSVTREDAASAFKGREGVPRRAITLGIQNLLEARRVRLLAFGQRKAALIRRALEGPADASIPASWLTPHQDYVVHLDSAAAQELPREWTAPPED